MSLTAEDLREVLREHAAEVFRVAADHLRDTLGDDAHLAPGVYASAASLDRLAKRFDPKESE